ncbi:MAG TPA: hypothetical protein V6C81_20660 [Planktothrix sp.]
MRTENRYKSGEDTLIATCPKAQYKPLIVIKRGPPWKSNPNYKLRYEYITYTYYMTDDMQSFHWYETGQLYRREQAKRH